MVADQYDNHPLDHGAFVGSATDDRNSFRGGGQIGYDFVGSAWWPRRDLPVGIIMSATNPNAAGTNL